MTIPAISFGALLRGQAELTGASSLGLGDYAQEIIASGLPGLRGLGGRALRAQLDGYLARTLDRDIPEQGISMRRPASLVAWLTAYAAATATTTSYNSILDAATPGVSDKPAKTTTITYRDILTRLWLLEPLPAWLPGGAILGRLQQAPKHHLADPALAARLLGVTIDSLLDGDGRHLGPSGSTLFGALFESLAALTVRVLAQAAEARVGHLRTRNGDHEIDLVVERSDAKVLVLEVKLAGTVADRDVTHLRWLQERLGADLIDAIVITTGDEAYRRRDGIGVVPLGALGP